MEFIRRIVTLEFLDGYRTLLGGLALIFTGLADIARQLSEGALTLESLQVAVLLISGGLGMIGIGGKITKAGGVK